MTKYPGAKPPSSKSLSTHENAAESCKGCDLYKNATQVVFGKGSAKSEILIVGEQPGYQEDIAGEPFVGPAGGVLMQCLEKAGIAIDDVYMTNAVKHFKWTPGEGTGSKARLHKKPNAAEVNACRPWLQKQVEIMKPKIIIALGATAAQSLLGKSTKIAENRGRILQSEFGPVVISWHPSSILRSIYAEDSMQKREELIKDLKFALKNIK